MDPGDVQLSFGPLDERRVLIDDATGRIDYTPVFLPLADSHALFTTLRDEVQWQAGSRPMYDRVVDVPRLTAHFGPLDAPPKALNEARTAVERHLHERFDSAGLNWYRNGNDSVAPHHDQTGELDPSAPIALLSLGSTRIMRIASLALPRRSFAIALAPGSLLVMSAAVQAHWTHGVPKVRTPVGPRISIAFRRHRTPEAEAPVAH